MLIKRGYAPLFYLNLLLTIKIVTFVLMSNSIQNKVLQRVKTDEGFITIFNCDFAEGGTMSEADMNLGNKIADAKGIVEAIKNIDFEYIYHSKFRIKIGLN